MPVITVTSAAPASAAPSFRFLNNSPRNAPGGFSVSLEAGTMNRASRVIEPTQKTPLRIWNARSVMMMAGLIRNLREDDGVGRDNASACGGCQPLPTDCDDHFS